MLIFHFSENGCRKVRKKVRRKLEKLEKNRSNSGLETSKRRAEADRTPAGSRTSAGNVSAGSRRCPSALVRITCKFSYICNTCNFTCITCKEFWLTCKNRDSRQISSFSKKIGEIPTKFHQNLASKWQNSIKKCWKLKISFFIFEKSLTIFYWNFEVWAVQKYANLVDRVKSFPTSIYLQKSASIQPRTSLSKLHVNSLYVNFLYM